MNELDRLHSALRSTLPGISARRLRACMKGLEASLEMQPQRRTQLTLRRLSLRGEKSGEFRFHPGVNINTLRTTPSPLDR